MVSSATKGIKRVTSKKAKRVPLRSTRYVPRPALSRDLQYFDTSVSLSTNVGAWVTNAELCVPTVGTSATSRFGDKILMKTLQYFIYVAAPVPIRIIIFYDAQPNNSAPPSPMLTLNTEAFKNPDLRHRFTILRDFWITNSVANAVSSNDPKQSNSQRGLVKLDKIAVFNGSTGTIADVSTGSLCITAFNGQTSGSAVLANFRVLFES